MVPIIAFTFSVKEQFYSTRKERPSTVSSFEERHVRNWISACSYVRSLREVNSDGQEKELAGRKSVKPISRGSRGSSKQFSLDPLGGVFQATRETRQKRGCGKTRRGVRLPKVAAN